MFKLRETLNKIKRSKEEVRYTPFSIVKELENEELRVTCVPTAPSTKESMMAETKRGSLVFQDDEMEETVRARVSLEWLSTLAKT
jgi:hypothetical protein